MSRRMPATWASVRAMSNLTKTAVSFALALSVAVAFAACTDQAPSNTEADEVGVSEQAITCTPGYETCDVGCYYDGGPSTDDCIIRCNAAGNGWITLENCGWAQNFPYSASCLASQPHPVCQNN